MIRNCLAVIPVIFLASGIAVPVIADSERNTLQEWHADRGTAFAIDVRGTRWTLPIACRPQRDLGGATGVRDLGDKTAERDLGADRSQRDLGDRSVERDLGTSASARDLGDKASARDLGSGRGERDLGDATDERDLGTDTVTRDLGDAADERDLGTAADGRDLGTAAGTRDLGDAAGKRDLATGAATRDLGSVAGELSCVLDQRRQSVILHGLEPGDISLPSGSRFSRVSAGPVTMSVRIDL